MTNSSSYHSHRQYVGALAPTMRRASSRAFTISSGSGPFSESSRFCLSWATLLAPRIMPSSEFNDEWCWTQRKAISVKRIWCLSYNHE